MGLAASDARAISGAIASNALNAAVLAPGQIELAVIPNDAHSRAAVRVSVRRASADEL
jgi:hypothetical protein